jgi:dihydrofolate reductase
LIISLLVAMDEKRGIGKAGKLPWHLSSDLRRFRELTMGHHMIVGRKTFESIGKPLPGRHTIVATRNSNFKHEGCFVTRSVEDAIALARERGETEVFVIGGAEIYAQALDAADRIYLTQVHAVVDADTFFPEFDPGHWIETHHIDHPADEKNQYSFTFKILERGP